MALDYADDVNRRKLITFDLNTDRLQKEYKIHRSEAYKDIYKFMLKQGFVHRQKSVYVSKEPMSKRDVALLVIRFKKSFDWAHDCVRHMDVANVGKQFNLLPYIKEDANEVTVNWNHEYDENAYREFDLGEHEEIKRKTPMQLAIEKRNRELEEKGLPPVEPVKKTKKKTIQKDRDIEIGVN